MERLQSLSSCIPVSVCERVTAEVNSALITLTGAQAPERRRKTPGDIPKCSAENTHIHLITNPLTFHHAISFHLFLNCMKIHLPRQASSP